ncbi:hypothetical protein TEA_007057 [Camellia sinensis var. sinensis]|uniref:F-box domain-containing protein n=1 Tax=Camellia sinensis var. sinensis TaxID=542762 RepID=A0A4S4CYR5_CAMSN|nr:hypothetical protein TEA_007057 [Camellia sinensis var. sinensis]
MSVHSFPIDKVVANDDILTQILIKLPVKSLLRFKSVSKHWLSLIVNPHFARCRNPNSSFVPSLFLYSSMRRRNPKLNFIPLQNIQNPSDDDDNAYLAPLTTIPSLSVLSVESDQNKLYYQIEIYSSETSSWRACAEPFTANRNSQFRSGVYWNGAINWFNTSGDSLYFNMEDEHVRTVPMPPIPHGDWKRRPFRYYGESNDHLHFYHVNLGSVGAAFPQMMQRPSLDAMCYSFAMLSLVQEKKDDEDSFMVLHISGKILRYNLGDKSFEKICDVSAEHCDGNGMIEDSFMYFWFHSFQYIECVSCI